MAKKKHYTAADHEIFKRALVENDSARRALADWLTFRGWAVEPLEPLKVAARPEDWVTHTDTGDVTATKDGGPKTRFEVKQLTTFFSGRDDWPFDYAIVCRKNSWERAYPKASWVVCFNPRRSFAILIDGSKPELWSVKKIKDRRHGDVEQEFLTCPVEHCRFDEVPEQFHRPLGGIAPRTCDHTDSTLWIDSPPQAGSIKTTCRECGGFVGYRPTKEAPPPVKK